jgi:hypothetical protein
MQITEMLNGISLAVDARDAPRIETRSHHADDPIRFGPLPTCKVPGASLQSNR